MNMASPPQYINPVWDAVNSKAGPSKNTPTDASVKTTNADMKNELKYNMLVSLSRSMSMIVGSCITLDVEVVFVAVVAVGSVVVVVVEDGAVEEDGPSPDSSDESEDCDREDDTTTASVPFDVVVGVVGVVDDDDDVISSSSSSFACCCSSLWSLLSNVSVRIRWMENGKANRPIKATNTKGSV